MFNTVGDSKSGAVSNSVNHTALDDANAAAVAEKHGTEYDERDMDRMGKLQQLRASLPGPSRRSIIRA